MAGSHEPRSMRALMVRALSFTAVAALTINPALTPVLAGDYRVAAPVVADGQLNARFLPLGVGKSIVVDLPRDIKDVLVADPKIANAVVRSAQRAYIIGAAVGQTNIVFFDFQRPADRRLRHRRDRDLNGIRAALKATMPNSDIRVEGLGQGVMLSGSAASPQEAQQANDLAARLAGGADNVVNTIAVRGRDQVMLKVTVAEVQRDIVKQLGVDLSGSLSYGTAVVNFNNANPFTAFGRNLVNGNNITGSFGALPQTLTSGDGHAARDGKRRRGAHAGGAEPDGDFRRCPRRSSRAASFRCPPAIPAILPPMSVPPRSASRNSALHSTSRRSC